MLSFPQVYSKSCSFSGNLEKRKNSSPALTVLKRCFRKYIKYNPQVNFKIQKESDAVKG